jgi:hypothetical protein
VPAPAPRRCALTECGVEFVPASPKQRYHDDQCRYTARNLSKRLCRNCREPVQPYQRFCKNACKWAYLSRHSADAKKRAGLKPVQRPDVAVLLPLGCMPRRAAQVEDPEEMPTVRRLTCRRYERCLSWALYQDWPGFTCMACPIHEPSGEK